MNTTSQQHIPSLSILFAPILAIYLLIFQELDVGYSTLLNSMIFILCNGYFALALNWALLWQSPKYKQLWALLISIISLSCALSSWQIAHYHSLFGENSIDYAFLTNAYLSLVCQLLIYLGIVYIEKRAAFSLDDNLLIQFNRYLASAFLLSVFAILMGIVLGLGFGLLSLLDTSFSDSFYLVILGLVLGILPIFLLLIPIKSRPYPFPYLYIFQWIALGFIGFYLLIALCQLEININSNIRLIMAAILCLLAIVAYDTKQPRIHLNLLSSGAGIVLSLMSLYGIGIRLYHQGITEMRLHALGFAILLLISFIGIGAKVLLKHKSLSKSICTINLILISVGITLLSLLPFPRWTLENQTARYLEGRKLIQQIQDDRYFFYQYGQAGDAAMKKIAQHYQIQLDEIESSSLTSALSFQLWRNKLGDTSAYFFTIPQDLALPDRLRETLLKNYWEHYEYEPNVLDNTPPALFVITTVDADRNLFTPEWLIWTKGIETYDELTHYRLIPSTTSESQLEKNIFFQEIPIFRTPEEIKSFIEQGISYHQPQYLYQDILIGKGKTQTKLSMPEQKIEH